MHSKVVQRRSANRLMQTSERPFPSSFIFKEAGSLRMKALKRHRLSSTGRLGECRLQEPTCAPRAVRLDEQT